MRQCDVSIGPGQHKVAADGFRRLYEALECVQMAVLPADRLLALHALDGWQVQKSNEHTAPIYTHTKCVK